MIYERPGQIERRSMQIIDSELENRGVGLPQDDAPVILRVIHTTADFEYAKHLRFTDGASRKGIGALVSGLPVVTDTNMALSGVSQAGLDRLGGSKHCFMADPLVAQEAKKRGVTRAVVCVDKAASLCENCIYAVGNAPTALFEIAKKIQEGFAPALVIAVPVGFVNVVEAKETIFETCVRRDIPCIAAMGRKGGSTVAAAILNALIYEAAQIQDPEKRGW